VEHGAVVLDLRTVDPSDDVALARALVQALAGRAAAGSTGDPT
jgi:hypothetical protein